MEITEIVKLSEEDFLELKDSFNMTELRYYAERYLGVPDHILVYLHSLESLWTKQFVGKVAIFSIMSIDRIIKLIGKPPVDATIPQFTTDEQKYLMYAGLKHLGLSTEKINPEIIEMFSYAACAREYICAILEQIDGAIDDYIFFLNEDNIDSLNIFDNVDSIYGRIVELMIIGAYTDEDLFIKMIHVKKIGSPILCLMNYEGYYRILPSIIHRLDNFKLLFNVDMDSTGNPLTREQYDKLWELSSQVDELQTTRQSGPAESHNN